MKHNAAACLLTLSLCCSSTFIAQSGRVHAEISYGELVDKITILTIKSERITDSEKLKNIFIELTSLLETLETYVGARTDISELMSELKKVNEALWDTEDLIRLKEKAKDFGQEFIQLARNVYMTNDLRFALKRKIDLLLDSPLSEEKSYEKY